MPAVIILAAAVILGGIVVVAMGRGGELARDRSDLPVRNDFRTWSDVSEYRPPAALLGYHAGATEHALSLIARTIAERDAEIDWLRKRLAEFQPATAAEADGVASTTGADWSAASPAAGPALDAEPAGQPTLSRQAGDDE